MLTMNGLFTVCVLLTVSVYCLLVDVVVVILILIMMKHTQMENG